jgi:hypothetical protein
MLTGRRFRVEFTDAQGEYAEQIAGFCPSGVEHRSGTTPRLPPSRGAALGPRRVDEAGISRKTARNYCSNRTPQRERLESPSSSGGEDVNHTGTARSTAGRLGRKCAVAKARMSSASTKVSRVGNNNSIAA